MESSRTKVERMEIDQTKTSQIEQKSQGQSKKSKFPTGAIVALAVLSIVFVAGIIGIVVYVEEYDKAAAAVAAHNGSVLQERATAEEDMALERATVANSNMVTSNPTDAVDAAAG